MKRFFTFFLILIFVLYYANAQQSISIHKMMHSSEKLFGEGTVQYERVINAKEKHPDNIFGRYFEEIVRKDFNEQTKVTETDSCSVEDSLALVAIYNKMNGVNWTNQENWLTISPVKDWWGITVVGHRVTEINFYIDDNSTQNVSGTIAEELWDLTELTYLDLSHNNINGSLSPHIINLIKLGWLIIDNNQLISSIPPEVGNLANLHYLAISNNQLEGSIPPEIGNLTNLQFLDLNRNKIEGSIPSELGNLINLQSVNLAGNQLEGSIPPEIGNLTNLQSLSLSANQLEGSIPPELGNLTHLQSVNLNDNQLEGSIPREIGNLKHLRFLEIFNNKLTGFIPPEIGNLTNLKYLLLAKNQIKGSIPPELGNLTNMRVLNLSNNQLQELPDLSSLNNLEICCLYNNRFSFRDLEAANIELNAPGNYYAPQEFLSIDVDTTDRNVTLTVLAESPNNNYQWFKDENALTNEIDSIFVYKINDESTYFCKVTNNEFPELTLQSIAFGVNIQNGILDNDYNTLAVLYDITNGDNWKDNTNWLSNEPVSKWHGVTVEGSRVTAINLFNNNISGTFPKEIVNLDSLRSLSICDNKEITGSIPPEIGNLTNLQSLSFSNNQLEGLIPSELGNLTNLQFLDLSNNQLEGSIPREIGNLKHLRLLKFFNNRLTGFIPPEIGNLTNLQYLLLAKNQIKGSIPPELGNLTNMRVLNLSNNQLQELPDLSSLNNLEYCYLYNNRFTFGDLETANIDWNALYNIIYNYASLFDYNSYAPQGLLSLDVEIKSNSVILVVSVESSNNNYQWYKDGNILINEKDSIFTYEVNDNSIYHCEVKNNNFPNLTLETETYKNVTTINFCVINQNTQAIEGATVIIDGESEKTTDANGEVVYELVNGDYNYTVNANGYLENTGSITVESENVTEEVALIETTYSITFHVVNENTQAIEGATVIIDGESEKTTDANGEVVYELVNGDYSYNITADGYEEATGKVTIEGSVITKKITLLAVPTYINRVIGILTEVYPNPATDQIKVESELLIESVEVLNITGNMVISKQSKAKKLILNINELESGIYLLEINFENGKSEIKRVVIK